MKEKLGMFVVNAFNAVRAEKVGVSAGEAEKRGYYWSNPDSTSGYIYRDGKWRKVDCLLCAIQKGWATLGKVMLFNSPEHVVNMVHEAENGPVCRAHTPKFHLRLVSEKVAGFSSLTTWTVGYQERFEKNAPIYWIDNVKKCSTEFEGKILLTNMKQAYNHDFFNRNVRLK